MLGKLKEKLAQFKDQIDEAEERIHSAKEELKEVEDKAERSQVEADGLRRRYQLLSDECTKVMVRVEESEARLRYIAEKNSLEESARRELEDNEVEGDEQAAELEANLKEAQQVSEETQHRLTEAMRRVIVLEKDYETASARCTVAEAKINKLTSVVESTAEKAKDLERFEDESFEREQISEEKITFLDAHLREEQQRADDAVMREKATVRARDSIEDEIRSWVDKKGEVEKEMESIRDMVDDM